MIKTPFFTVCLLLVASTVLAQRTIKGRVVNAATGEPLAGSSVFISNTSIGTVTDNSGFFILDHVPAGRNDLIVSSIGYETNVYSFSAEQLPLQLRVEMQVKVRELQNVIVEPWVEEGWDRWGKMFMESFIGLTTNARSCRIKNEKAIRFRYYRKSNRVTAYADEPLIIENKALGYTIRYQLEDFEMNFKDHALAFSGYPFFEEIDKDRRGLQRRWKAARDKAYYGSMMHFMRCLYVDSLQQNGYEVRRMVRIPNLEKERVKQAYRVAIRTGSETNGSGTIAWTNRIPGDSMSYYEKVMRQDDYTEVYGKSLLTADSVIIRTEGQYKILYFTDYLYITYKNEKEEQEYLAYHRELNRKPFHQRSYVWLVHGEPVTIDVNGGYFPPQELFSMAYWGWSEKIADLLPQNYIPEKE